MLARASCCSDEPDASRSQTTVTDVSRLTGDFTSSTRPSKVVTDEGSSVDLRAAWRSAEEALPKGQASRTEATTDNSRIPTTSLDRIAQEAKKQTNNKKRRKRW